jgi:hypothetical protein
LDGPERVADAGGADLMFQFQLERRGDGTKHYRKMKRRQRAHLDSMRRKCVTARRRDDVGRRRGGTGKGKGGYDASWAYVNITGLKNKEKSCGSIQLLQMDGDDLKQ